MLPTLKRRLPEAKLPFEQPRILAAMVACAFGVRVIRSSRLGAGGPGARGRCARAGTCAAVAARQRPGRVSRRRAHLDRQLRARRAAHAGTRALRLAPDRPAARDVRRGERRHCLGARCATAARHVPPRRSGRLPPRPSSSAGWFAIPTRSSRARSRSRATSSSTATRRRSRAPSRSRSPRRRSAPASSSKTA